MKQAAALVLSVLLWGASLYPLTQWARHEGPTEYMSVPPVHTARILAAGADNLFADALYLGFIDYFGKHLRRDKAYHNVKPVLDLITDLDPLFEGAYLMGALALGDNGDVDASEALWNKCVRFRPYDWRIAYEAGMNLFLFASRPDQYERAGKLFARAASLHGAPKEARFMEARCYDVGQRRDLAIAVWRNTYLTAASSEERAVAERTLKRLGVPLPARNP